MKLLQFLRRACAELGLGISSPFILSLRNGIQINALALIPQLGATNGMLIVQSYDDLRGMAHELPSMGYGYSVLDEPSPIEEFDVASYKDMFSDWGWGNLNTAKPEWMK
jgi:hypothetical protein